MVKIKKKLKKITNLNSNNYQIKTRNRDKKLSSMSREIKNLKEPQWFPNTNNSKLLISKRMEKTKKKIIKPFLKNI